MFELAPHQSYFNGPLSNRGFNDLASSDFSVAKNCALFCAHPGSNSVPLRSLGKNGVTVLFVRQLGCFDEMGHQRIVEGYTLPNQIPGLTSNGSVLPGRGTWLNFTLVPHDGCTITSPTSDESLDHEFGRVLQLPTSEQVIQVF